MKPDQGSPAKPAPGSKGTLPAILIVSVLLRVGVALYLGDAIEENRGGTHDQVSYDALAQRVVDGYGFSFGRDRWPAPSWSHLLLRQVDGPLEVDSEVGAALLVRRAVLQEVGGLDIAFDPVHSEEVDWCYRVKAAG